MIKLENAEVMGWEAAIRGMRNPMNSWKKSDSYIPDCCGDCDVCYDLTCQNQPVSNGVFVIGLNDFNLMMRLRNAGTDHRKFMRMITVYVDITAPLYWWKEFKTYRAGKRFGDDEPDIFAIPEEYLEYDIEMNSCSTMHKIHEKEFTLDDFSCEHLFDDAGTDDRPYYHQSLVNTIYCLNAARNSYLKAGKKRYWWQIIQLLPSSYNQKRTVMLNYEVLANIYKSRKNHKLDEWRDFCDWIKTLPYSEIITGIEIEEEEEK